MKTAEDVESYLLKLGAKYDTSAPGLWIVHPEGGENLVVSIAGPVVAFRMKVMVVPVENREKLFETLLRLNTSDMVHGAFGLEGDAVVIVHALALENLDYSEFSAVIDDFALAVGKHYERLNKFRPAA